MALIASKSNAFIDYHSQLELKTCVMYLWIPTFIVWSLNLMFLLIHHRVACRKSNQISQKQSSNEIATIEQLQNSSNQTNTVEEQPSPSTTVITVELPRFSPRFRHERFVPSIEHKTSIPLETLSSPLMINRSVSVAS